MTGEVTLTGTMCSSLILTYIVRYSYLVNQLLLELAIWWHHVTYWTWLCNILLYIRTSDVSFRSRCILRSRSIVKTFESSHGHTYPLFFVLFICFLLFLFSLVSTCTDTQYIHSCKHPPTHQHHHRLGAHVHICAWTTTYFHTFVYYVHSMTSPPQRHCTPPPHPCSGVTCNVSPPQIKHTALPHHTPVVVLHVTYHRHKHPVDTPTPPL